MAFAWFICPYKRQNPGATPPIRYPAIDDFATQIRVTDKGDYSVSEVLGDCALVKVRANDSTLTTVNNAAGFVRFPNHFYLNDTLGDLTVNQRNTLLNKILSLGYTQEEIDAALPANWQNVTLRQVLRFIARRRLKPRYDQPSDTIILDGATQPVRPIEEIDKEVG